uniref:Uncharacterized protein n=1 Tax=Moniliophthora roreri TaxID=221103 RepID=A0A0W0FC80_MONRR
MPYALPTHNRIPPVASNVTSNQLGERERVDRKRRSLSARDIQLPPRHGKSLDPNITTDNCS